MNKTDKRSSIPHLDPNVKNFFEEYLEKCKAQNSHDVNPFSEKISSSSKAQKEADVNSFFNMISEFLLIRDEYNTLSHEICEAYFQLFVNPCREVFLPQKQEQILFNAVMNAFVDVCIIQDELSRIEAKIAKAYYICFVKPFYDKHLLKAEILVMAIFHVIKNDGYTVMSNFHLRDKRLSLKAKGLLSQMLSLPENWDYSLKGLTVINRENIDAIRTAVVELENTGYITRRQGRDDKGKMAANEYNIYVWITN